MFPLSSRLVVLLGPRKKREVLIVYPLLAFSFLIFAWQSTLEPQFFLKKGLTLVFLRKLLLDFFTLPYEEKLFPNFVRLSEDNVNKVKNKHFLQ